MDIQELTKQIGEGVTANLEGGFTLPEGIMIELRENKEDGVCIAAPTTGNKEEHVAALLECYIRLKEFRRNEYNNES